MYLFQLMMDHSGGQQLNQMLWFIFQYTLLRILDPKNKMKKQTIAYHISIKTLNVTLFLLILRRSIHRNICMNASYKILILQFMELRYNLVFPKA